MTAPMRLLRYTRAGIRFWEGPLLGVAFPNPPSDFVAPSFSTPVFSAGGEPDGRPDSTLHRW